jgi:hypothetical protein
MSREDPNIDIDKLDDDELFDLLSEITKRLDQDKEFITKITNRLDEIKRLEAVMEQNSR